MITSTFMQRLKEATQALHDQAEGQELQGGLTRGELRPSIYKAYLAQLYLIHQALERLLKLHRETNPVFQRSIHHEQMQEDHLQHDLQCLSSVPADLSPLPATQKLLGIMSLYSAQQPLSLLGLHYVLLGSKHGGKYIARQLEKSYELKQGDGNRYFDPYGSEFMPLWLRFKNAINECDLSESDGEAIIEGARQMYATVRDISRELLERIPN